MWQAGMAIVDFTNPAASKWYNTHLERLMEMGCGLLVVVFFVCHLCAALSEHTLMK
jgi:uncharacterized RmlC-like cupin family protein